MIIRRIVLCAFCCSFPLLLLLLCGCLVLGFYFVFTLSTSLEFQFTLCCCFALSLSRPRVLSPTHTHHTASALSHRYKIREPAHVHRCPTFIACEFCTHSLSHSRRKRERVGFCAFSDCTQIRSSRQGCLLSAAPPPILHLFLLPNSLFLPFGPEICSFVSLRYAVSFWRRCGFRVPSLKLLFSLLTSRSATRASPDASTNFPLRQYGQ